MTGAELKTTGAECVDVMVVMLQAGSATVVVREQAGDMRATVSTGREGSRGASAGCVWSRCIEFGVWRWMNG
jgi:hypothetical protein